ncbi:MAG: hypothetical protein AMK72_06045 [Planctomycetes bacterium SM23_25]|nr:MAG: hypothetical protein AMS14_01570 [Planctomycetes bacterium DG_20]KPK48801.1 MAG: hypothetical protein AMK72_06045 [Planctomycetes bacterium SM23_25]
MKRFKWKLERVLDIKTQHERALRSDLFTLAQAIARVREEILERRTVIRTLLGELAKRRLADRLPEQAIFLEFSAVEEREIDRLRARLRDLESERAEKQRRFLEVRSTCKTLKRLREEARSAHMRDVGKREQMAFDESAHTAFARRASPRLERTLG